MYQRGDIVLVPFPFTDLTTTKRRPALIISNDLVNSGGDLIIVMVTSQDKGDFLQIEITEGDSTPILPKKSFVRSNGITAIDQNLILGVISTANPMLVEKVSKKIQLLITEETSTVYNRD